MPKLRLNRHTRSDVAHDASRPRRRRKKLYTVIALWDGQRWAQSYWAESPEEAERLAELNDDGTEGEPGVSKGGDFQIAAVLHGRELVA